jgi:ABC-2 type transport system ATP-binding protein
MSPSLAVELIDVTKRFGTHLAVDKVSLSVPKGCVYGFIGRNGAGKTTTLRMISRIYLPDTGTVRVLGETVHGPANDRVAYLPEERGLYNQMVVRELLRFYAQIKNYNPTRSEIDEWLERMDLITTNEQGQRVDWGSKPVRMLSKGMSQKVQFIATVISKPELVLLDEPFSGLDPKNAVVLRTAISDLRKGGTTIIFSTHDMRVAEELCDYIFMIDGGKKVLDGTLAQIRQTYGRDVIRLKFRDGKPRELHALPGISGIDDSGNVLELRLNQDGDPHALLQHLIATGPIDHFEIASPSLQDIFVRVVDRGMAGMATMG